MKTQLSFIVALALPLVCVRAQSDTEAVRNVISLLRFQERYERSLAVTTDQFKEAMLRSPLRASIPPNLHKEFDDLIFGTIHKVAQQMQWQTAKEDFTQYFLKTFISEDLQTLQTFLESPTGQKFATSWQNFEQELTAIAQKRIAALRPQLQKPLMEWHEAHKAEIEAYSKVRK